MGALLVFSTIFIAFSTSAIVVYTPPELWDEFGQKSLRMCDLMGRFYMVYTEKILNVAFNNMWTRWGSCLRGFVHSQTTDHSFENYKIDENDRQEQVEDDNSFVASVPRRVRVSSRKRRRPDSPARTRGGTSRYNLRRRRATPVN